MWQCALQTPIFILSLWPKVESTARLYTYIKHQSFYFFDKTGFDFCKFFKNTFCYFLVKSVVGALAGLRLSYIIEETFKNLLAKLFLVLTV